MDTWKYYRMIHPHHKLMNPLDEKKLEALYRLMPIGSQARVTDIKEG